MLEAPGKETAREETAPGKEKRKKRKKKQAERWFSEKSLSDRGGMVSGAHNSGVLGHPPPLLSSLWPSPLVLRCEGSGGLAVPRAGSRWLLINALPWPVLTDGVVFLFLFSLIYLFCTSFSMEERGSHVTVSLISNHEYLQLQRAVACDGVNLCGCSWQLHGCNRLSSPVLCSSLHACAHACATGRVRPRPQQVARH